MISTDYFRAYATQDVIGVEVGGALKNIIAIGSGAADGLGLGLNSKRDSSPVGWRRFLVLPLTRGQSLTMAGLAGMGDLVLTCTGTLSRNRTVGFQLGQGKQLDEIRKNLGEVAEGVNTTRAAHDLAKSWMWRCPLPRPSTASCSGADPRETVFELMGRELKHELA